MNWPRNRYPGPGGGLYTGPGGGLYTGPGGGLYTGPGGPYTSNWPPIAHLVRYLLEQGYEQIARLLADAHHI